jgi:hypothetical protein
MSAISPAVRKVSPSKKSCLVVSIKAIASATERQASSAWPMSANALAKADRQVGANSVQPVDSHPLIPEMIVWTASDVLPVKANSQARFAIATPLKPTIPFSSASEAPSSDCVFAAA